MTTLASSNTVRPAVRWFKHFWFLLIGFLFTLLAFELLLRAAFGMFGLVPSSLNVDSFCLLTEQVELRAGENFTGFYQFDERLMRRWVPHVRGTVMGLLDNGDNGDYITLQANGHGWRDAARDYEKPAGVYRVVLIGDSFGEPWRRVSEQGIASQLDAWLKSQGHPNTEVLNLSISGNNPVDYSLIVQHEALEYAPDLIIVLLYVRNDVIDGQFVDLLNQTTEADGRIVYAPEWVAQLRSGYAERAASPAEDGSLSWDDVSRAQREGRIVPVHVTADGTQSYAVRLEQPRLDTPPELQFHCFMQHASRLYTWLKDRARIMRDVESDKAYLRRSLMVYQSAPPPDMETGWQQYERLLLQMAGDAAAQNTRIAFITLATGEQVYPELMAGSLRWLGYQPEGYSADYPVERTQKFCAAHKLDCWFLQPVFRQVAASGEQLFDYYNPHDETEQEAAGHYTPAGYRLAAQTIGQMMVEQGWLAGN